MLISVHTVCSPKPDAIGPLTSPRTEILQRLTTDVPEKQRFNNTGKIPLQHRM